MRLILHDDQLLFSEALASLLTQRGHDVLGCPTTPEAAAELVRVAHADACLLNVRLPASNGTDVIRLLKATDPNLAVVALAADLDAALIWRAIDAGADGVCLKVDGIDEIERVLLRSTGVNGSVNLERSGQVWSRGASSVAKRGSGPRQSRLITPRERAVLELLIRGASTSKIAAELGVGQATIRTHLQHLFNKFGVHSRLALVACAVRAEIVPIDPDASYLAKSS